MTEITDKPFDHIDDSIYGTPAGEERILEPAENGTSDMDLPRLKSAAEFIAGFSPPDYLVDGIVQRGFFYTLTGRTGHGKTAAALLTGAAVAAGTTVGDRKCRQGTVCFFAGENSDDVRARLIATLGYYDFAIENTPLHFFDQIFNIKENAAYIAREIERVGPVSLVIIDSFAAFFPGSEENDNVQLGRYARDLRSLCNLPGRPTVLALAHPTKSAPKDLLLPRGGGAVVAEVDGNLRLWSDDFTTTELHWCGKLRGPDFEPIVFRIQDHTCPSLNTKDGRSYPTVVAVPMTETDKEQVARETRSDEDALLDIMLQMPNDSQRTWCDGLGWINGNSNPQTSRVSRTIERLRHDKLIEKKRGKWVLTKAGRTEARKL